MSAQPNDPERLYRSIHPRRCIMDPSAVIIMCLLTFIFGLVVGVILGKPTYPPRY